MNPVKEFQDVGSFALHLAATALAIKAAEHRILDRAAQIIEKDAKRQLGHYQDQVGPFNGWPDLAESTQKERERKGFTPDDPGVRTGAMRDSITRQVEGSEAAVGSDKDEMVWFELGTPTQPPRPVLGPAAYKNKDKIESALGQSVVDVMEYGAEGAYVPLIGLGS
jgi:HK97 gp10 family phage protein